MVHYVYILHNKELKQFYIGFTNNLKRRLLDHQTAKLPHRNKNFKLIYFEGFTNKIDAQEREKYFKTTQGRRTLRLMLKYSLSKAG